MNLNLLRRGKYESPLKLLPGAYVLILFLTLSWPSTLVAQDYCFQFSDTSLSEALSEIANITGSNIAFDAEKLAQVRVKCILSGSDTRSLLEKVLGGSGFTYLHKYDSYLIIEKRDGDTGPDLSDCIRGISLDASTGDTLPWVNVYLPSLNTHLYASSDGSFLIPPSEDHSQNIFLSYLGYRSIDTTIITEGRTEPFVFRMEQESRLLEQVEIETPRISMLAPGKDAGQYALRPATFINLPNYGETDLFRALELLPGINYSLNSSDLSIRGGTGDQNLVLLDGFTLYNLDHYFGAFSSLNPNVVQDIQVFKGGFDSRYGERISGIIDARGKSGDSLAASLYGGINLLSASMTAELPVSKKFSMLLSGRKGYSSFFSNFYIENIYEDQDNNAFFPRKGNAQSSINPEYNFYDLNVKLKYDVKEGEVISLSAYMGQDRLILEDQVNGPVFTANIRDESRWNNFGAGLTWTKAWNDRFSSALQAGASGYFNQYSSQVSNFRDSSAYGSVSGSDILQPGMPETNISDERNFLGDVYLSMKNTYTLNPSQQADFGIIARDQLYFMDSESQPAGSNPDIRGSSGLWVLYLQDRISAGGNLRIKPGLRLNYHSLTGKFYLEPRLSANYIAGNHLRFKFSAGRYYQFINRISSNQSYGYNRDYWVLADGLQHPVLSSNHFILGSGITRGKLMLDIETWYRTINGLQQIVTLSNTPGSFPGPQPGKIIVNGSGQSYGLDLLLKYQDRNYQGWISYTPGRSTGNFSLINDGSDIPSSVDRLHSIDLTQMYSTGKWNFSLVYLFSTGQPYLLSNITRDETSVYQTFGRLPNYHRVDVSANYNFTIKRVSFRLGLSVINLLNRQNYYDIDRRSFLFNSTRYEETSIVKSQGITPNIFLFFRF